MSQKIMKRVLAFVLSFAMILGSVSMGQAAEGLTVKAGSPDAVVVGSDVIVPITLENNDNAIYGLQFKVTYDADVLEYKSTTPAEDLLSDDVVIDVNDTTSGSVGVAYVTIESPITTSAAICNIAFTAKAVTAGTTVAVTDVKALDADANDIAIVGEDGTVVVDELVQYDYVITGTDATAKQGETTTVDFNVVDNKLAGVKGAQLTVTYDATVLTVAAEEDVVAGDLLEGAITDVNVNESGIVGIMSVKTEDILSGDGTLLSVTFEVKDDAATAKYPVGLTVVKLVDGNANPITANGNITEGSVTITESEPVPVADYTITGSQVSAEQGATATVDFVVSNNTLTGVKGADFEISYDASVLSVAENDVTAGELLDDAVVDVNVEENGKVGVMSVSTDDIVSGNGTLVSVTFTVKADAATGDYPIGLTVVKLIDEQAQAMVKVGEFVDGQITVTAADPMPAYKEAAKAAIDEARATYADADYDAEGVAALNQAVTDAKAAIDAATDMDGVDTAKQAGFDALAAVETKAEKSDYTITGSQVSAKQGETATVVFTVSDNKLTGVQGVDFEIAYDATAFTVAEDDVVKGALLNDAVVDVNVEESGKVGLMSVSTNDIISGDGTLVSVTFTVKADAATGDYPIDLTVVKLLDGNVQVMDKEGNVVAGKVTVTEADQPIDPLPAYKEAAKAAIDAARATYADADYDAEGVVALDQAVADAKAAIDAATTEAAVDTAKQDGLDALDAVKTKAEKAAEEAEAWKEANADVLAETVDTITIDDQAAVDAALAGYNNLSADAKALVADEKALLDALKAKIAELKADAAVVAEANAWKAANADVLAETVDTVSIDDEAAVDEALTGYNNLSADAKALVTPEKSLLDALKDKIAELKAAAAVQAEAEAWKNANADVLAETVDTVTMDDEAAVDEALAGYEELSDEAKELVPVEKALLDALKAEINNQKLPGAKEEAIKAIEDARAEWNGKELTEAEIAQLDKIVADAIDAINGADTLDAVNTAKNDALNAIDEFKKPSGYIPEVKPSSPIVPPIADDDDDKKDDDQKPGYVPSADTYVKVYRNLVKGQKAKIDLPTGNGASIVLKASKPGIVSVTEDGQIKAHKVGKGNISVYVTKGDVTTKTIIRVTVKSKKKVPAVRELGDVIVTDAGTPVTSVTKKVKVGGGSKIKVVNNAGAKVSYYSNNSKVAKVTSNGKITGVKAGKTTVVAKVTSNGVTLKYRVYVTVKKK